MNSTLQSTARAQHGKLSPRQVARIAVLLALLLVTAVTLAGEAMPWDSGLKKFADALTGTTAMYISLLAFAGCMMGLIWGGELNDLVKKMVVIVCATSGVVGAAGLAKNLAGVQVTGATIEVASSHRADTAEFAGLVGVP